MRAGCGHVCREVRMGAPGLSHRRHHASHTSHHTGKVRDGENGGSRGAAAASNRRGMVVAVAGAINQNCGDGVSTSQRRAISGQKKHGGGVVVPPWCLEKRTVASPRPPKRRAGTFNVVLDIANGGAPRTGSANAGSSDRSGGPLSPARTAAWAEEQQTFRVYGRSGWRWV